MSEQGKQEHFDRYEAIAQQIGITSLRAILKLNNFPTPAKMAELAAQDEHLNNIPLKKWDDQHSRVLSMARSAGLKSWSLSDTVSTLKHVAKHHYDKTNAEIERDTPKPAPVEVEEPVRDPEQITLEQFIEKHSLQFECRRVDSRKDGLMPDAPRTPPDKAQRHFRCRVTSNRGIYDNKQGQQVASGQSHSFSLYFSQGSAHTDDPTLADVLDCLASDASGYENAKQSVHESRPDVAFNNWAGEYGYDTDSRSAEKIYKTVKRQAEQLKRVLGAEAFEELLYKTEKL